MSSLLQPGGAPADALLDDPAILKAAAALDKEAANLEQLGGALADPNAEKAEPELVDWKEEARQFIGFATEMFFPLYPRLETVWTPAKLHALEGRLAAVLKKYDMTLAKLLGQYGAEIMLAAIIAPAILPTAKAIRADLADLRAQAQDKARAVPPAGKPDAPPPPPPPGTPPAAPPDQVQLHQENGKFAPPPPPNEAAKLHERA